MRYIYKSERMKRYKGKGHKLRGNLSFFRRTTISTKYRTDDPSEK